MSTIALPSVGSTHAGFGATPELHFVLQFDDADTPTDAIDALLLSEFVAGRQPWSRTERLARIRRGADLVPDDARVVRTAAVPNQTMRLAVGPGFTLRAVSWTDSGEVTVTATTRALADAVVTRIVDACAEPAAPQTHTSIGFWHGGRGPTRDVRRISRVSWADIRDNYAAPAATALDRLVATTPETVTGRLVLLHGPPGTGGLNSGSIQTTSP